jgi:hypothetical protein
VGKTKDKLFIIKRLCIFLGNSKLTIPLWNNFGLFTHYRIDFIPNGNIFLSQMWLFEITSGWENDLRLHLTEHVELAAIMNNLRRYRALLNASRSSGAVEAAYVHREASGIFSVDTFGVTTAKDMRAYVYPDDSKRTIHLLCIGNQFSKAHDMAYCKNIIFYISNENQEQVIQPKEKQK